MQFIVVNLDSQCASLGPAILVCRHTGAVAERDSQMAPRAYLDLLYSAIRRQDIFVQLSIQTYTCAELMREVFQSQLHFFALFSHDYLLTSKFLG